jgi:hypothetical protein
MERTVNNQLSTGYALKLSPQEQLVAAFGFFTLKPPSSAPM